MKKVFDSEQGSSIILGLLLVLVMFIIGAAGWYFWNNQTTKDIKTNTSNSASTTVTDFYYKYIALNPPGNPPTQETFLKQYGTNALLTYFRDNQNGIDPIVCAQALPDNINIISSTSNNKTGTVVIEEVFGTDKVNITITVIEQNGLKIDNVKCPNPLPSTSPEGP